MERKLYTFLIFPGLHGKVHKIQLPFYVFYLVLAFSLVGVTTVVALASSYTRMLLKISDYNSMRADREALKNQYRSLEKVVTQTNAKLNSLESLATEVALTYGFGEARRSTFPRSLLVLAAQSNPTLDSSYHASLYAFNLLKTSAANAPTDAMARSLLLSAASDQAAIPSIWPVRGQVTAGFGERLDPLSGEGAFHAGIDIAAPRGTTVECAADGIVVAAGYDAGYGNAILVDHGSGITSKYGHLSKIDVVIGQEVKRGQIIGAVGATGKTTGPHLHYEVHVRDMPVNPAKYLHW
ncbi:MAG: M23 family metallopeptidase [Terriglobia bacterium]|jgi:murein DD-endopeptidase MepM/ murein hydrolase activator NlpD